MHILVVFAPFGHVRRVWQKSWWKQRTFLAHLTSTKKFLMHRHCLSHPGLKDQPRQVSPLWVNAANILRGSKKLTGHNVGNHVVLCHICTAAECTKKATCACATIVFETTSIPTLLFESILLYHIQMYWIIFLGYISHSCYYLVWNCP